jgi:hypothetical protein
MDEAPYYAEAFSPISGRCFRLVSRQDQQAGPIHCPEPPRWSGSFQARNGRRDAGELIATVDPHLLAHVTSGREYG